MPRPRLRLLRPGRPTRPSVSSPARPRWGDHGQKGSVASRPSLPADEDEALGQSRKAHNVSACIAVDWHNGTDGAGWDEADDRASIPAIAPTLTLGPRPSIQEHGDDGHHIGRLSVRTQTTNRGRARGTAGEVSRLRPTYSPGPDSLESARGRTYYRERTSTPGPGVEFPAVSSLQPRRACRPGRADHNSCLTSLCPCGSRWRLNLCLIVVTSFHSSNSTESPQQAIPPPGAAAVQFRPPNPAQPCPGSQAYSPGRHSTPKPIRRGSEAGGSEVRRLQT